MCNFIKPDVFNNVDDITKLDYLDPENQATNDELGIGTTTRLLLCGDLEDEVVGTSIERRFFKYVRSFYEASVRKILDKFPFEDDTIKELSFLDPRYRTKCTVNGMIHLSTRFTTFSTDEIDTLIAEFQEYRIASDQQFPSFDYKEYAAVDHFWAAIAMAEVCHLETFQYSMLSRLAKILLVLPHSNADPKRLFSMVRKICTDQQKSLAPSTICDLLIAKLNNSNMCYDSSNLLTTDFLRSIKTATSRSLGKIPNAESTDDAAETLPN